MYRFIMYVDDASLLIWCIAPVALWFLQKAHTKYGISIFKKNTDERLKRLGVYLFCIEDILL